MNLRRVTNLVKENNGSLLEDSHNILNSWKNYFCQLLNVHWVKVVSQTEVHTAEALIPESGQCKVEIVTEKLKKV
jgi:hypothetical protein